MIFYGCYYLAYLDGQQDILLDTKTENFMNDLQLAYLCYGIGCALSFFLGVIVTTMINKKK